MTNISEVVSTVDQTIRGLEVIREEINTQISNLEAILEYYASEDEGRSRNVFVKPTISRSAAYSLQIFYMELHDQISVLVGGLQDSIDD